MKISTFAKMILVGAFSLSLGGCFLQGSLPVRITSGGADYLNLAEGAGVISYSQVNRMNCVAEDRRLTCVRGEIKVTDQSGAELTLFQVTSICETSDQTVYGEYFLPGQLLTCTATGLHKNQKLTFTGRFAQIALPFPMVSMIEGILVNPDGQTLVTQGSVP